MQKFLYFTYSKRFESSIEHYRTEGSNLEWQKEVAAEIRLSWDEQRIEDVEQEDVNFHKDEFFILQDWGIKWNIVRRLWLWNMGIRYDIFLNFIVSALFENHFIGFSRLILRICVFLDMLVVIFVVTGTQVTGLIIYFRLFYCCKLFDGAHHPSLVSCQ